MGRSPCCDKVGLKKGPWTPEEDEKLLAYIQEHGHGSWRALPLKAGLQRCGKSCRLRWINYLRPDIKRGKFTLQEEQTIIQLHALLGNRWSAIATHLSKRTDNEIKNYWNTHLKKRLIKMGIDPVNHKPKNDTLLSNDGQFKSTANLSHMAQWESARLEAEARLVKQSNVRSMSPLANKMNSKVCSLNSTFGPPLKYLDIHKAWSGTLDNGIGIGIGESESSSSTVTTTRLKDSSTNLYELVVGGSHEEIAREESEEVGEYKDHENGIDHGIHGLTIPAMDDAWTTEPLQSSNDNDQHVPNGNFLEHFTDLLLCSSNFNDRCSLTRGDNSDIDLLCNDKVSGPTEIINNCCEDKNKNYWDNILNMVNSFTL